MLNLFITAQVWNAVDLLIIDWLLLAVIQPRFIFMPGTIGLKGCKEFGFHLRGFFVGFVGSVIASTLIAGISELIEMVIK